MTTFHPHRTGFSLSGSHIHIGPAGEATVIEDAAKLWAELMSGPVHSEEAARVAGGGWLVAAFHMTEDPAAWEMHPDGEEVLYLLSGGMEIVLDEDGEDRVVQLRPGTACVVPRGVWHRQVLEGPCDLLALTFGRGTQHRPV
ncbi:MAG: cupin domain-containing protein [Acidimicrobiia bacterium]